ncbi:(2Fe-2S)-binding protein [Streptomyces sp. NPDC004726]
MRVTFTVNGRLREADDVWEGESLLHVLRERLGLPGSKNACEQGECGSCTVRLDGVPVCACLVAAGQAEGREVMTVEGLADHARRRAAGRSAGARGTPFPDARWSSAAATDTDAAFDTDAALGATADTGTDPGPGPMPAPGTGASASTGTGAPTETGATTRGGTPTGDGVTLSPIQRAFIDAGAVQCGFCTPGLLVAADELLERDTDPSDADIREALSGNLCRCTGYEKILDAVRLAAARQEGAG